MNRRAFLSLLPLALAAPLVGGGMSAFGPHAAINASIPVFEVPREIDLDGVERAIGSIYPHYIIYKTDTDRIRQVDDWRRP